MQPKELHKLIKASKAPVILDVRSAMEFRAGHIPGAERVSFWKVLFRLAKLPAEKDTRIVVLCESGARAEMVLSMLAKRGYSRLELLDGDMAGWRNAGFPMQKA